ncbi:MAG: hypothetical protein HKN59_02765 [Gammaproteobacteria bacterium]|nr:hypothetical protein [Gammaproteobacteria bacterium]
MSDVLDKLTADHVHIARLLALFEEQVRIIHAGENPDASLLQDIMGFMTHYPDLIHHPLEDLVFEHVINHDKDARKSLQVLLNEHEEISRVGHELKVYVDSLETEALVRRDILDKLASDYLKTLRRHMRHEEEHAFPLARKLLDASEWDMIRAEFKVKDHEVFGKVLDEHYQTLYHSITGTSD